MSLIHALKWSFLAEASSKTVQPIIFIVLARILTPDDFGVMTAALMVIAFSQIFWEAGMGKALIQRQSDIVKAANVAFWINIALGLVIAGILCVAARPLAQFVFHDDRVTHVLQVMALQVILGSLSAVHTALLQKDLGFRKLFWVRFATVSLPGIASIPLAWHGMGYWALVAGTLAGQAMQVILLWRTTNWRPTWSFDKPVAREMARFGAWVSLSGLLAWFYIWADALVVGIYLGSHELGLYRTGNQVAIMIFALILGPITPVLYSHLSRIGQDKARLGVAFEKVIKVVAVIAIPVAFTVFAIAEPLSSATFGDRWQGVGFVIGVLALTHGIAWTVGMNGEAYRALGKPNQETLAMGIPLVVYVVVYFVAIEHGFEAFVWSRLMAISFGFGFQLFLLQRLLPVHVLSICWYVARTSLFMLACTSLTLRYLAPQFSSTAVQVAIVCFTSVAACSIALFLTERYHLIPAVRAIARSGRRDN